MTDSQSNAEILAQAGAALLDKKIPNWVELIDLDSLEMSEPCSCVIGQIADKAVNLDAPYGAHRYMGFNTLAHHLTGLDGFDELVDHGFEADDYVEYNDLQTAWVELIEARRAA